MYDVTSGVVVDRSWPRSVVYGVSQLSLNRKSSFGERSRDLDEELEEELVSDMKSTRHCSAPHTNVHWLHKEKKVLTAHPFLGKEVG